MAPMLLGHELETSTILLTLTVWPACALKLYLVNLYFLRFLNFQVMESIFETVGVAAFVGDDLLF